MNNDANNLSTIDPDEGISIDELLGETTSDNIVNQSQDYDLGVSTPDEVEQAAHEKIDSTEVTPALQALFDSGEAKTIERQISSEIDNTEVDPALRQAIDTKSPEEWKERAQNDIQNTDASPINRAIRPISSIPKDMMLRVDDLHRRTGLSKKFIMRNLEATAKKAEEDEYQDFINTQTGKKTKEHLKYPFNQSRMRGEFALLKLEPELEELEELGEVHKNYLRILQMKSLNPNFNDLEAQRNFWHEKYPDGVERGKAMNEFKPYIDKLETSFWEDKEDQEEAILRAKGMKDAWYVPNSAFNVITAGAVGWSNLQNITEEFVQYLTGHEVQLGKFSGDRYVKQMNMAIEMLNNESYDNWISPEWYARGRNIIQSLSTAVKGTAAGGVKGASLLFGMDAFASGTDAAREAGLEGGDIYDFATAEAGIEAAYNYLGGKVFGVGAEAMMSKAFTNVGNKGLIQAFKDYGKDGVKKALKDFGSNLIGENAEELATEVTHAMNEVESGVDPDAMSPEKLLPRLKETVIQSSIMGGTPGAIAIGKSLLVHQAHSNQISKIEAEKIERIKVAAESSELAEKDPEAIQNFLEKVLPNLEAVEFYTDSIVETYKQEAPEVFEEDMKKLGLSPKAVHDGAVLGAKVEVKATKILAYSAGRRLIDKVGIKNINTIGQNSISENDEISNELADAVKKMSDEVAEIDKNMRQQSPILEKMVEQLKDHEYFTKKDARKLTAVIDSMFKNLYQNGGLTPDEYLKDIQLALDTPKNLEGKMHPDRHNLMKKGEKAAQSGLRLEQAAMWNFKGERKEFVDRVLSGDLKSKAYVDIGTDYAFAPGVSFQLPSDIVKHVEKSHSGTKEVWNDIESVLSSINRVEYGGASRFNGEPYLFRSTVGGNTYGGAIEITGQGRGLVTTVFSDHENSVNAWLDNQIKRSEGRSAPRQKGRPRNGYRVSSITSDNRIIPHDTDSVNNNNDEEQLSQNELTNPDSSRGWVDFTKDKKKILTLTATADASTVMHEFMHIYVHDAINLVNSGKASDEFVHSIDTLIEFATDGKSNDFVELDRNAQERISRAFEAYLMEGRAPSTRLAESFDAIKKWMLKVYKTIRNLNVELSDDVRGVFDSMLASKEEIEDARRYYNDRSSYAELYLADKAKAEEIKAMKKKENLTAEQKQLKRRMYIFKKINGGINSIRKEIEKVIKEEALYKSTIPSVVDGGGLNTADITSLVGKDRAAQLKKHGKSFIKKAGSLKVESEEFLDLASENNMTIEEFVNYLIDAPSLKEQVEKKLKERLADEEKRISEEEGLGEDDIYHSDGRLRILLSEYNLIKEMLGGNPSEYQLTMKTISDAARDIIGSEVGATASRYYKFSQAEAKASRRARDLFEKASKVEDEAIIKELQEEASKYVRREMLNHACVLESIKARDLIKKIKQRYATRKIEATTKNVENTYREIILAIAQKFKLMKQNHRGYDIEGAAAGLETNIQVQDSEGNVDPRLLAKELKEFLPEDVVIPDWVSTTPLSGDYKSISDLTINQIIELDELLGELITRGNTELKALRSEHGRTIEELSSKSASVMKEEYEELYVPDDKGFYNPSLKSMKQNKLVLRSVWNKSLSTLRYAGAHLKMIEYLCDKMDGYQSLKATHTKSGSHKGSFFGPMRSIFNKASKLENDYEDRFNRIKAQLLPHLQVLDGAQKRLKDENGADKFGIEGVPVPEQLAKKRGRAGWDAESVLSCMMNLGNDKNSFALMNGYGFERWQVFKLTSLFTDEEWDAIQGVWDTIDTLFPELDKVHFALTNRHLVKEEAQQLTITTKEGKVKTLRGGYYPLGYDNFLSAKIAEFKEFDLMLDQKQSTYTSSGKTKDGATKKRLEDEDGKPIVHYPPELSLRNVLDRHLRNTIRTITHAEFIKEIDAVTRHEDWQETMISRFGIDNYRAMRDWISYLARPEKNISKKLDKGFEWARKRNTELALGFRVKAGFKQRLSLYNGINAMGEDGTKYLIRGMMEVGLKTNLYGSTANEKVQLINTLSSFMNNRQAGVDREVRDYLNKLTIKGNTLNIVGHEFTTDQMRDTAFWWIQANDRAAVYPLWQGAFLKAMETDIAYSSPALDTTNMSKDEIEEAKNDDRLKRQARAVEYADSIVRISQPSTQTPDLASIQRAEGIVRFFTAFMTFTLKAGNRLTHYYGAWRNKKIPFSVMAKHIALEWGMPSLTLLSLAMMFYDEEEEPGLSDWLLHTPESMIATIPIARGIPAAVRYRRPLLVLPGTERIEDTFSKPGIPSVLLLGEMTMGFPIMNLYRDATKEYQKITGKKEK